MRRHVANITLIAAAFFVVTGCFWSSGRVKEVSVGEPAAENSNEALTGENAPSTYTVSDDRDRGDFKVEHLEIQTPRYKELDQRVKAEKILENAAVKLNAALMLPADIVLRTKDCRQANAFYDPSDRTVTMCYELMDHFFQTFKSAGHDEKAAYEKMSDAVRFVFLHEIAHALIDQYKLPITGNEEDAADRCSAFINLKELGDEGLRAVYAAADAFEIESKQNSGEKRNMSDEHLLQGQRFYNSLCMIYGSNPDKHADMVSKGYLPKDRAVRCQSEYQRSVDSWITLLEPWRK